MLVKRGKKKKRGRKSPKVLENDLHNLYYNLKNPSAYASAHQLYAATRTKKYSPRKILTWLEQQKSYTLHKPVRYKFPRRPYNVRNVGDLWEVDLADFRNLSSYNDEFNYVLACIDVLSKFVYTEVLPDKTAKSVASALERIFARCSDRVPHVLQGDKGKEFLGAIAQNTLKKYNVIYRKTRNDVKASVIERFLRTLKGRMWRYFTHRRTKRYIDVLDRIVEAYNLAIHSATKTPPAGVTRYNAALTRVNLLKKYSTTRKIRCKYRVEDLVRISRGKKVFEKGYGSR